MKKVLSFVAVVALLLVGAVAAMAQAPDWDVIAESEPHEIDAAIDGDGTVVPPDEEPVLDVRVSITGDTQVLVDEENRYFFTVVNDDESTETLEEWALGLSIGNDVESLDDLSISTPGSTVDITEGTTDVDVELDEENDVVWLRGSVNRDVAPGHYLVRALDITFHQSNFYVATAYVLDVSEDDTVEENGVLSNGSVAEEGDETEAEVEAEVSAETAE